MAKYFMALHFKKKTRRIKKPVTVGNISEKLEKSEESWKNSLSIQSQTLYIPQIITTISPDQEHKVGNLTSLSSHNGTNLCSLLAV